MSLPVCPNCRSTSITWGIDKVPNGSNGCLACGYVGPVRDFHPDDGDVKLYVPTRRGLKAEPIHTPFVPKPRRHPSHGPSVTQTPKIRQWWND